MTKTYDARLATRITASVDARLRQLALAARRPISHVLDDVLDTALPTSDEMAARLRELASGGHVAGARPGPSPARAECDADSRLAQTPATRTNHSADARSEQAANASAGTNARSEPPASASASTVGEPPALTSQADRRQR